MLDPFEKENRPYFAKLSRKKRAARAVLWLESVVAHTWRPFFWVILFCGLWMLSIPAFFGPYTEGFIAIIFFVGLAYLIKKDLFSFQPPENKNIESTLERSSALPLGTIRALYDTLSNPKKHITRHLWEEAQENILRTLKSLRSPSINISLSRKDPSALRYLAVLFFISGLMVSQSEWKYKIIDGMFPVSPSYALSQGKSTNIWITPPEYTQKPTIQLSGYGHFDDVLDIPEGSKIRIRVNNIFGKAFAPYLVNGDKSQNMTYMEGGLYGIETTVNEGKRLIIKQSFIPRSTLSYNYIIDQPPEIISDISTKENETENTEIAEKPEQTEPPKPYEFIEKGQITFPLIVKDDYGVKDLKMEMNIDKVEGHLPLGETAQETRLVMSEPNDEFKITPVYDMTWHTWAGLPVTFEYTAIDHKGQTATLDKIHLVLPEREFKHPMAQSLIAMRKRLAWDYDESFMEISRNLESLLSAPDYFQNDKAIFLSIRSAASRLRYVDNAPQKKRIKAASSVISLLWDIAITIEDGNLSLAMRELRDARRALENALRDPDASEDEISRLMDNLREKTQQYFMEMQREMQKRMAEGENIPQFSPENFSQMITPDAMSQLMAEIEQALRDGDEQKAQELMSKLQRMLEMLDPNMRAQMPSDMQMMQEGINELQELIDRQETLLGQTKKQADTKLHQERFGDLPPIDMPSIEKMLKDFGIDTIPPAPKRPEPSPKKQGQKQDESAESNGEPSIPSAQESKSEQEALRYILGQLMLDAVEEIDEIPESMGKAEKEMRGSENRLGDNDPHGSIPHQEKAIEHLKESQEQLSQQLQQRMQQMIGIGMSGQSAGSRDPLGRQYGEDDTNGRNRDSDVKVPDEHEKKRVDEILRMLRERSGDRSRPDDELDYFRRLLRQF